MAYAHAKSRPQDTIFVCPGVVDLLHMDPITGISNLHFSTVVEFADYITGLLEEGDTNFHQAYPQSHIIFAPITSLNLRRYSMTGDEDPFHQYVVD